MTTGAHAPKKGYRTIRMPPGESCPHAWRVRLLVSSLTPTCTMGGVSEGQFGHTYASGGSSSCVPAAHAAHTDLPTLGRRLPLDGGCVLALLTQIARERRRRCGLTRLVTTDGLRKDPDRPPGPPLWCITPPHSAYHRGPRRGPPRCWPSRSSRGRASLTVKGRPPRSVPCSPAMAARACVASGIPTKPKPRGRPVSRSVDRCILVTSL
jgi:hypothetical protein